MPPNITVQLIFELPLLIQPPIARMATEQKNEYSHRRVGLQKNSEWRTTYLGIVQSDACGVANADFVDL